MRSWAPNNNLFQVSISIPEKISNQNARNKKFDQTFFFSFTWKCTTHTHHSFLFHCSFRLHNPTSDPLFDCVRNMRFRREKKKNVPLCNSSYICMLFACAIVIRASYRMVFPLFFSVPEGDSKMKRKLFFFLGRVEKLWDDKAIRRLAYWIPSLHIPRQSIRSKPFVQKLNIPISWVPLHYSMCATCSYKMENERNEQREKKVNKWWCECCNVSLYQTKQWLIMHFMRFK